VVVKIEDARPSRRDSPTGGRASISVHPNVNA